MLDLHPISYDDKDMINYYSKFMTTLSYEYSFNSLYLWRDLCNTKVGMLYDSLIIQKSDDRKGSFFMMPYYKDIPSLYKAIDYLKYRYNNYIYLLGDIDDDYLKLLLDNYQLEIQSNEDCFEYVYLTEDLINLKGNKYHKKRNHYNNFTKLYNYTICSIDNEKTIKDCIDLLDKWESKKCLCSKELLMEPTAIKSILFSLENLSLKSIAVYVDGNLAGFSIGEKFNNSAIIHIEKCNTDYRGIYAFINNEFLKLHFKDTIYVNRQEDCGSDGLQQSKESYHPHLVLKKYLIKIK